MGKFGTLRAYIARRGLRRTNITNEDYLIPTALLAKAQAVVQRPSDNIEAALQYCELAVLLHTQRRHVHLHLIGKLSMLDQASLKANHGSLYERIRLLADDP